jgi:hypothetical protein
LQPTGICTFVFEFRLFVDHRPMISGAVAQLKLERNALPTKLLLSTANFDLLLEANGLPSLGRCDRRDVVSGTRGWHSCLLFSFQPTVDSVARGDKFSNLVDSASSHTLVSKIKPCMSKYKSFTLKLRTAHYISYSLFDSPLLLG